MNRISELLKKGYFVQNYEVIANLSEEEFQILISHLQKSNVPRILTEDDIKKILEEHKKVRYEINVESFEIEKNEIKISDIVNILKKRYERLSSYIKEELNFFNLISINKISKRYKTFSLIGIVYEIQNEKIVIEDLTSRIDVYLSEKCKSKIKNLDRDIVIGLKCVWENDKIVADEIFFPKFKEREFEILNKEVDVKLNICFNKDLSSFLDTSNRSVVIIFDEKIDKFFIDSSKVFLNPSYPIFKIWINNFLFLLIDGEKINFSLEKTLETRLIDSNISKLIEYRYKDDVFILTHLPYAIIVSNFEKEEINFDKKPFSFFLSKNKNYLIDLKQRIFSTI